jgi:hypothetical protein
MHQVDAVLQRHFASDGMETLAAAAGAECAAFTDLWFDASLQTDANLPVAAAVPLEDQIALIKRRLRPARSTQNASAGDSRQRFATPDAALSERGRVQQLRQAIETRLARFAAAQQATLERRSISLPLRGERPSSGDVDIPAVADEYGAVAIEECGEDGVAEEAITTADAQSRSSRPSTASLAHLAPSSATLVRKGTHSQVNGSSISRLEVNMAASRHAAQRREAVPSSRAAAEVIAPIDELLLARSTLQALVLCTLGLQAQHTSAALVSSLRPEDAGTAKLLDQVASQQATMHQQISRSKSAGVGSRGSSRRLSIARALSARATKAGAAVETLRARSHSKFSFVVADEDPEAVATTSQHSNPLLHSSRSVGSTPRTPGGGLDAMQQQALAAELLEDSLAVVDAAAQSAARAARGAAWQRAVGWFSCCRRLDPERSRRESSCSTPLSGSAGDSLVLRAMQAQRTSETSNAALRHLRGTAGFRNSDRSKMSGLVRASVSPSAMPSNAAAAGRTPRSSVVARRQSIAAAGDSLSKHAAPPAAGYGRVGRGSRRPSALLLSAFPPAPVATTSPVTEAYKANPLLHGGSEEGAHSEADPVSQPATSPRSASGDVRRLRLSARHPCSCTTGSTDTAEKGEGSRDRRAMRGSFVKPITGAVSATAVRSARR